MYAIFFRQPIYHAKHHLLSQSWHLFSMLTSLAYAAVLSSFLTVQLREVPLRSFAELSLRSSSFARIVTRTSVVADLVRSEKEHVRRLGELVVRNGWTAKAGSSGQDDGNEDPNQVNIFGWPLCPLLLTRQAPAVLQTHIRRLPLFPVRCGIALSKHFCCTDSLNTVLTRIQSAGLYEKFMDDELYKKWLERTARTRVEANTREITVSDVQGVFLFLGAGYMLSLVTLVVEICFVRLSKIT
ncbi:hypothetical protein JTE90_010022 [Oedothorax gibbosus]|uniref:Ionotropic glutamate receptor C-terminal domain-containing protein n=1 Tax=Oedothorax gibbosus TaxID=931172 RepID=A0AAV6TWX3_9ARAC|nr:hypothetical protein JTE90_010022 [Oedothorax gibbosus]